MGQLRHFWPLRTTFSTAGPPKYQPIGPVSEICVPDNAKCHHRKFRRDRSTLLGLVRCATDTDYYYYGAAAPPWRARSPWARPCPGAIRPSNGGRPPKPPLTSPGCNSPLEWGGHPPKPPLFTRVKFVPRMGGKPPQTPQDTSPSTREWLFWIPQSPRYARGLINHSHIIAHQPPKISARSAHRGLSNQPHRQEIRAKTAKIVCF